MNGAVRPGANRNVAGQPPGKRGAGLDAPSLGDAGFADVRLVGGKAAGAGIICDGSFARRTGAGFAGTRPAGAGDANALAEDLSGQAGAADSVEQGALPERADAAGVVGPHPLSDRADAAGSVGPVGKNPLAERASANAVVNTGAGRADAAGVVAQDILSGGAGVAGSIGQYPLSVRADAAGSIGQYSLSVRADAADVVVAESLSGRAAAIRVTAAVGAGAFGRLHQIDSGRDSAGKGPVPGAVRPKLSLVVITRRLRKLRRVAKHPRAGRGNINAVYAASDGFAVIANHTHGVRPVDSVIQHVSEGSGRAIHLNVSGPRNISDHNIPSRRDAGVGDVGVGVGNTALFTARGGEDGSLSVGTDKGANAVLDGLPGRADAAASVGDN